MLIEDLHWADQTSLRLLAYAAEELRGQPVLFVATVRTVDPRLHPHLAHALAGLARLAVRRVPVPPLDAAAVAELLQEVVAEPEPALVEVLTRRTDGNPFFVLEMARLLVATGRSTAAEAAERLEVPDGIADVLRLRVLQLAEPTRTALGVASVVGRSPSTPGARGRAREHRPRRPRPGGGRRRRRGGRRAGPVPVRARAHPRDRCTPTCRPDAGPAGMRWSAGPWPSGWSPTPS